jgi:hypothetical protein
MLGVVGVTVSEHVSGLSRMKQADAAAAIGLDIIVVYVS